MKNIIVLLLFSVILISCNSNGSIVQIEFDQTTFNNQRQLWQLSNFKNYSYRLQAIGFFSYDGIIIVENGDYKNNLPSVGSDEINVFINFTSIDEIYKWIDLVFTSNNNKEQQLDEYYLMEISVLYDEMYHIPIEIHFINYVAPGVHVSGVFDYYISDFKRLE